MVDTIIRGAPVATSPTALRWGAIFGGAFAALAIWLLLYALGLALGLSTIDPDRPYTLQRTGLFTGIWGLATPLVALFIGGLVASRGAGVVDRGGGALHGLVVWSFATVLGAWGVTTIATTALSGIASVGKGAVTAGADAIARGDDPTKRMPVEPGTGERAKETAIEAAPETGAVFWGVFGALSLGMLASILGGVAGARRRRWVETATTTTVVEEPAAGVRPAAT
jgi:hypothetical protein